MAADLVTLDVLARLQLAAKRCGGGLQVCAASDDLLDLIEFAGLGDVLGVEPRRQPEEREQGLGVEKEGELPDPPV
jgi:hypothetical protein